MPRRPRIALVIPTMNEVEGLRVVVPQIDRSWVDEIVVVDGGSTDGTVEICKELGLALHRQDGRGLAMAYKKALEVCTSDVFIFFTPDGNSLAEKIPEVREALLQRGDDMVVVSRYLLSAKSEDDDRFTGVGNWMFTTMINVLFGTKYTDSLVAYRALTRSAILRMRLHEQESEHPFRAKHWLLNHWEIASCTRAPRLGLKTSEIPGVEPKRIGGVRKLSIVKNGTAALVQILWDFFRYRPPKAEAAALPAGASVARAEAASKRE